jgi:hypothetical protein
MALFLTISEGTAGRETEPILATSDPQIIEAVVGAIKQRVARSPRPSRVVARSAKPHEVRPA